MAGRKKAVKVAPKEADIVEDFGFHDEDGNPIDEAMASTEEDNDLLSGRIVLTKLGETEISSILDAIDDITDRFLTDIEGDLIWLMRQGRRPVEISKILRIPECEVVRLRRNVFRKIRVVYTFEHFLDKGPFLTETIRFLGLNEKQSRILRMFFDYYGLRPIAEAIGTRPSNIHRCLESIRDRLDTRLPADSPQRSFLAAFQDFKYLHLRHNPVAYSVTGVALSSRVVA